MHNNTTLNRWITLVSSKDIESILDLYEPDAVLLGTFCDKIRIGKSDIRDYFNHFFKRNPEVSVIESNTHIITNSLHIINGFYDFKTTSKENQIIHARFTFVFKKKGESWKILTHHSSVIP